MSWVPERRRAARQLCYGDNKSRLRVQSSRHQKLCLGSKPVGNFLQAVQRAADARPTLYTAVKPPQPLPRCFAVIHMQQPQPPCAAQHPMVCSTSA